MATTVSKISRNNNILTGSASQLVTTRNMIRNFGSVEDYVELHVADPAGKNLYSIVPFNNYTVPGTFQPSTTPNTIQDLIFDPATDIKNLGIQYGDYNLTYNVLRPKVVKSNNRPFFIKEISGDRTELRLVTNNASNIDVENGTFDFINEIQSLNYFKEFYLNFGNNKLLPAVNIALDKNTSPYSVLIKLLNPLPISYKVNDLLNIVDEISNPQIFDVNVTVDPVPVVYPTLRGPNFDLDLDNVRVGPTPYYNFSQITTFSGAFAPQLQQLLGQLSASNFAINVDYTDYENFVHFSSAARRLEGFKYKLTNIEAYTKAKASASISTSPTAQLDVQSYQNKINTTIQSFDGWEQYLYYETGSHSWPKQTSVKPYIIQSVTSSASQIWYSGNYDSASLYDDNNQNYLLYAMPGYITENDDNELAFKFVASIGQMFDDVWIHIKAISDLYQAKNSLTQGISKDIVYFALQSMGINAYTDQDGNNQFQYLYGVNPDGTYKPQVASYQTLISASNYQMSGQDQQKGIYKRLYSNLPLLLKSKGTTRFIQYLNTIFGIPDTIMSYTEYGGVDKVTSSFEYEYDRFTYALNTSGSNTITIPWNYTSQSKARTGYNDIVPNGIEFRFKAYPTSSNPATQSLFYSGSAIQFNLLYSSTGSSDSIYSGSTGEFGYFQFKLGGLSVTSSTIPVYYTGSNTDSDNSTDWYSVLVQRTNPDLRIGQTSTSQTYTFYVKNNVWGEVGHVTSASLTTATSTTNSLWYTQGAMTFLGGSYPFSGSIQELRLWSNYISESVFDSHVLNPESIESNNTTASFNDLASRFTLGNNLYTYNHSLTSSVASTHPDQNTQILNATFANFPNINNYSSFTEVYYADVANSGYSNPVTDKIRVISGSDYGTQLLPNKSIQVPDLIPTTKDIHLLDASLSPQDEIDRAIIAQFGSEYSIDDIIGNPFIESYVELDTLQYEFFKKFNNKYNYKDYIRLIEFFHNSLFRTLKDFTPARTNVGTGIVVKPHLLERPAVKRFGPFVTHNEEEVTIDTAFLSGSNGGDYSQSLYDITRQTILGKVTNISDARDFFTGELPSASIKVNRDQYNPFVTFDTTNTSSYSASIWNYSYNPLLNNVPDSILSTIRKKISWQSSGSNPNLIEVLEPVALQDFTYQYQRHSRPRYIGSTTNSTEYNFFVNDDFDFQRNAVGPYGRNSAIDKNTIKFAYFSEAVATGSQLIAMPERTNLYLKYLIDDSGSLTELTNKDYNNIRNNQFWNLYQVQNTFKPQDVNSIGQLNVSLFDNQNPSDQKTLDGNKTIWDSGHKFYPTLWRIGPTAQSYGMPEGFSTATYFNKANYTITGPNNVILVHYGWAESSLRGTISYTNYLTTPLPFDVIVTIRIRVVAGSSSVVPVLFPAKNPDGSPRASVNYRHDRGLCVTNGVEILDIKPANGVDPGVIYTATDAAANAYLTVHSADKRIVSCSAAMSQYYRAPFYFSGSDILAGNTAINNLTTQYNTYIPPAPGNLDYPFQLNPGDVVRFDGTKTSTVPTTQFREANEYMILDVNATGSRVTFTLDRPVQDEVTGSTPYRVERYVFSRKIQDETNIIIQHSKKPGQTSGGVIKNVNLQLDIDDKVANIVSDLKSKIFSTVLVP